jgi:hypothetical protein
VKIVLETQKERKGPYCRPHAGGVSHLQMQLETLPQTFAVCRLSPEEAFPEWALASEGILCLFRSTTELSVVCEQKLVPSTVNKEGGWSALRVKGTLDFALTGVLARITAPLAKAEISLFAISSFDTDYVLVKQENHARALTALLAAGLEAK